MKVLLTKTIENLGVCGEVKVVADGYARNYLLPKKYAVAPTAQNIKEIESEAKRQAEVEAQRLHDMKAIAEKVAQISCTFTVKADESGHLYGSVTEHMIAEEINKEGGYTIEHKAVRIDEPIKELGVYDVAIHLHSELDTRVRVWVVEEAQEAEARAEKAKAEAAAYNDAETDAETDEADTETDAE